MPIYNGAATLQRAIDSVLTQTYHDFELLIIDDGSSDDSLKQISRNRDPRIRLLVHEKNRGLAETRNHLVEESRGEYVAWLDCDDWSHPSRLACQVTALETDPGLAICGSWSQVHDDEPRRSYGTRLIQAIGAQSAPGDATIRATQPFGNLIATSSVTMRLDLTRDKGLTFEESLVPAEDFAFWVAAGKYGRYLILSDFLTYRFESPTGAASRYAKQQVQAVAAIRREIVERLGIEASDSNMQIHNAIADAFTRGVTRTELEKGAEWLNDLVAANRRSRVYEQSAFMIVCAGILAGGIASQKPKSPRQAVGILCSNPLSKYIPAWFARTGFRAAHGFVRSSAFRNRDSHCSP